MRVVVSLVIMQCNSERGEYLDECPLHLTNVGNVVTLVFGGQPSLGRVLLAQRLSVHVRTWFHPGTMIKSSGNKICWYTEVFVSESDRVVVMHGEYHRSAKHSEREASLRRVK